MSDSHVYVVAETSADSWGIGIIGVFDDGETAEAAAENERDPDTHGQTVVVRREPIRTDAVSPHPDCELGEEGMCEGDSDDAAHHCDWHGDEMTLCESCIEFRGSAIEVLEDE